MIAVTISSPTSFVANRPPEYVTSGTTFAAHVPVTELWTANVEIGPRWGRSWTFDPVTEALQDMSLLWRSALSDFSRLVSPSDVETFRAATSTAFAGIGTAFRSALRDVLLGATMTTGEMSRSAIGSVADGGLATSDDEVHSPAAGDRRLYALAAVGKLQRLLRLSQDETSALVRVSRPTLWNWEQGRVPQERSLRHLHNVAAAVDLLVDAVGGEAQFDPVLIASMLQLDRPLSRLLAEPDGPTDVLSRLFGASRRDRRISLMPDVDGLGEIEIEQSHDVIEPPQVRRRRVRRRATD